LKKHGFTEKSRQKLSKRDLSKVVRRAVRKVVRKVVRKKPLILFSEY
jgi:mRNA degradation ribonuclease J1/J2